MSDAAPTLLETLVEKRSALADEAATILDTASTEARDLTVEEEARAAELNDEMRDLTKEIELRESIERSRFAAADASKHVTIKSEPLTYNRSGSHSYFADLAAMKGVQLRGVSQDEATARLQRHAAEVDVEMPKRHKAREQRAETEMRGITGTEVSPFEKRAGSRTDGSGGYFVPPIYLIDDYSALLRYGRPFVNASTRSVPLPVGTDSINIPKVTTGTLTGIQTADNAALSNQDIVDTQVTAPVKTIGGYYDISIQALEQSGVHQILDQVILQDLIADYNLQVDTQVLNGSGSSGQITGVLNVGSINTVTYTDASPTAPNLWSPLAKGLSQSVQNRKRGDGWKAVMHPRRWYWIMAALDSSNRPLVVPSSMGQYNPLAENADPAAEGFVGNLALGVPVILDGNMPTTVSSNQDPIVYARGDDLMFFEGELRTDTFGEILSSTAGVRFRVFNYVALLPRYATAITSITGTGLAAPSGF